MKKLVFGLAAVATGVVVVLAGVWVYATYFVGEAPAELTLDDPATPTPAAPTPAAPTPAAGPTDDVVVDLDGDWTVTSGVGGYRVNEVLNGVDNTVVGRTEEVSGTLTITGGELASGEVTLVLKGIETDNAGRDDFFQGQMDTGKFPDATFTFSPGVDISGLADGEISVTVPGMLTFHGQTLDEIARVEARREGNVVTVVAKIDIDYTKYGVNSPNLGFAIVEPLAVLEARLEFEPSA